MPPLLPLPSSYHPSREAKKTLCYGANYPSVLHGINLEIKRGEMVAIMGPSGSGKSTLMNILGCLDKPSQGRYLLDGVPVSEMNRNELADIRNQKIGFVFQGFHLFQWMTAIGNVELPLIYAGIPAEERQERASRALKLVGLGSRARSSPSRNIRWTAAACSDCPCAGNKSGHDPS